MPPKPLQLTKELLLSKIHVVPNGCWEWTAGRRGKGRKAYGVIHLRAISPSPISAHRAAAFLWLGTPFDRTITVCHHCDNPPCINPEHLFVGTAADNIRDMVAKGRYRSASAAKTHCPKGHPYSPENARVYDGRRFCRQCDRDRRIPKSVQS